jgi:hypothetical protein
MKKFNDWMKEKALGMKKEHPHKIEEPGTVKDVQVKPGTLDGDKSKPVKKDKESL